MQEWDKADITLSFQTAQLSHNDLLKIAQEIQRAREKAQSMSQSMSHSFHKPNLYQIWRSEALPHSQNEHCNSASPGHKLAQTKTEEFTVTCLLLLL